MPRLATKLIARVAPWGVLALGAVAPLALGAVPAQAQDVFGFFRPFAPPAAPPVVTLQPSSDGAPLIVGVRLRRKEVRRSEARVEKPSPKVTLITMPLKAKDPGDIANPVPQLLADETLRSGDLVMFPGGLRSSPADQATSTRWLTSSPWHAPEKLFRPPRARWWRSYVLAPMPLGVWTSSRPPESLP